ncbi:hypothetical protein DL93DRAFT_2227701 [Clavulina sp. PMI_390]|nr:hypothetical protein DL93DRAFT_2227701 [Clavulina sp. PMI_390]
MLTLLARTFARRAVPANFGSQRAHLALRTLSTCRTLFFPPPAKSSSAESSKASSSKKVASTKPKSKSAGTKAKPAAKKPAKKAAPKKKKPAKRAAKPKVVKKTPLQFPPPPKRPGAAFFAFLKDQSGKIDSKDILVNARASADKWNAMSTYEQQPYRLRAAEELEAYRKDFAAWKASLTSAELRQYTAQRRRRLAPRRKDVDTNEKVKRPASPYMLYVAETFKDVRAQRPDVSVPEVMTIVAQNWKGLAESEKAVYAAKYAEQMPAYLERLEKLKEARRSRFKTHRPDVIFPGEQ